MKTSTEFAALDFILNPHFHQSRRYDVDEIDPLIRL